MPDEHLLSELRAAEGEGGPGRRAELDAWETLWLRHHPRLTRYAASLLRVGTDAEDLASEALVRALTRFALVEPPRSLERYLFAVVRNLVADQARGAVAARRVLGRQIGDARVDDAAAAPVEGLDAGERRAVADALGTLSPRHREVLVQLYLEGRTVAEIATRLGLTENAVNQLSYRARRAFRRALATSAGLGAAIGHL